MSQLRIIFEQQGEVVEFVAQFAAQMFALREDAEFYGVN
jgi:hypothetical protein